MFHAFEELGRVFPAEAGSDQRQNRTFRDDSSRESAPRRAVTVSLTGTPGKNLRVAVSRFVRLPSHFFGLIRLKRTLFDEASRALVQNTHDRGCHRIAVAPF